MKWMCYSAFPGTGHDEYTASLGEGSQAIHCILRFQDGGLDMEGCYTAHIFRALVLPYGTEGKKWFSPQGQALVIQGVTGELATAKKKAERLMLRTIKEGC